MDFNCYKREIELIEKQNPVEQDLYSLIANVIRERKSFNKFSLRDVSNRRRTKKNRLEKLFYGISGFPDFVVLDLDFLGDKPCKKKILGAVEVKYIGGKLKDIKNNMQLKGEILWFNKVIYTNGLEWEYYNYLPDSNKVTLISNIQENMYKLKYGEKHKWTKEEQKLLDSLNDIQPKWSASIMTKKSMNGSKIDYNAWQDLIKKLSSIEWINSNL